MNIRLIEERIRQYQPTNAREELNAFKEIAQEVALLGLSRAEFFKGAGFQGGTALRIVYGLARFSEDLDFVLFESNPHFVWERFLKEIKLEFESLGFTLEVKDRSQAKQAVKKAFLKENSFGKVLQLSYLRDRSQVQTVQIKLEIDTNPPKGSQFEAKIVDFPMPFSVILQTLPCLFASKLHALLSREYVKGRDWYDFIWYVTRKTPINFPLLQESLLQQGPWQGKTVAIDQSWLSQELQKRIQHIDWKVAAKDVEPFLRARERESLGLWSDSFFGHYVDLL